MKILMVITEADLGGAQRHVLDVSRALQLRGHEVIIAVGGQDTQLVDAARASTPAITVLRVRQLQRAVHLVRDAQALAALVRLVRTLEPDVVHCHSSKAGVLGSVAGRLCGRRVVYTAHGFVFREERGALWRWVYRLIERTATWFRHTVIAVSRSDAEAALAAHVVPSHKLITIHNGIDESVRDTFLSRDDARAQLSAWTGAPLADKKIALCIANFYPAKNVPLLLRAFEFVVRRVPTARLVVVGDGEQRMACEQVLAQTPALRGTVFLVGQRSGAARVLRGGDVLCLSSTKEGLPYVILEAKLAGVPVVATRVGGVPEFGEGPDLSLVVPHSPEMLAEAIAVVLREGVPATVPLPAHFTLHGMVGEIERVYEKLFRA